MTFRLLLCSVFLVCVLPIYVQAAVVINEIAWMGTEISANDEWIELHNNGDTAIDVSGWVLKSDGGLEVVLTGAVDAGQYAVLERTDDDSAPGSAFLIYTGALANTGATLWLYRADNSLEDMVSGGEDWVHIGGDNITKETAQYTADGWITAKATPGQANKVIDPSSSEDDPSTEQNTEGDTPEESGRSSKATTLYMEQREVQLRMQSPKQVYVHQKVPFSVEAFGVSKPIVNSLEHHWNFGDLHTAKGAEVTHRFQYPGEYVVTLESQYKSYRAFTRQSIIVLPVSFSMTRSEQGDIQVHNDSKYEVDISGYQIFAGSKVMFPKGTIILPNATITIAKDVLPSQAQSSVVWLKDEMDTVVATLDGRSRPLAQDVVQKQNVPLAPLATHQEAVGALDLDNEPMVKSQFSFREEILPAADNLQEQPRFVVSTSTDMQAGASNVALTHVTSTPEQSSARSLSLSYLALLGVMGTGIFALFVGRKRG